MCFFIRFILLEYQTDPQKSCRKTNLFVWHLKKLNQILRLVSFCIWKCAVVHHSVERQNHWKKVRTYNEETFIICLKILKSSVFILLFWGVQDRKTPEHNFFGDHLTGSLPILSSLEGQLVHLKMYYSSLENQKVVEQIQVSFFGKH